MERLQLIWLSMCLLVCFQLHAQSYAPSALEQDPVFEKVASNRIQYPAKPARQALYGRYYAGFRIDDKGHIRDISVLYPVTGRAVARQYGFDYEIISGLKHMPPLNPKLAGLYVLPVAFCFTHYGEGANPIVPTNVLPVGYDLGSRTMLGEVRIYASSPSDGWRLRGFPASHQIGG